MIVGISRGMVVGCAIGAFIPIFGGFEHLGSLLSPFFILFTTIGYYGLCIHNEKVKEKLYEYEER